jgi:hypothetical protein
MRCFSIPNISVMKNVRKLLLTCAAGAITATSFGQFTLSGEYRPRAEYRHGFQSVADSNQSSAFFLDQRMRLNLDYKVSDYEFYLSVQDIRTWGSNGQLNVSDGFMSVHQAWAKVNFNPKLGLKLGRQEIIYDDHRIFGNVDWAQQARSHDAAILKYGSEKVKLDVGFAFNQAAPSLIGTEYTLGGSYRDMQFAWFNAPLGKKINMSLLVLNLGKQSSFLDGNGDPAVSYNYTQTLGTHTKFDFGKFKMDFNGYYQMGSSPVTPVMKQSGYLIGLDAKYQVAETWSLGLGYEAQSGTSQSDTASAYTEVNHNFNPHFGTNHKFNGYMDYFYVGNGHGNAGLQDAYLKIKHAKGKWTLGVDVHLFMTGLGVDVLDPVRYGNDYNAFVLAGDATAAAALDPYSYTLKPLLGTEIDLSIGTKINESVALKVGYSHMIANETLASLKGVTYTSGADAGLGRTDQINNWSYVMIIIKPTFLTK